VIAAYNKLVYNGRSNNTETVILTLETGLR
jgi:hypothetical protein